MVLSALPTDPQRTATHVADAAQTSALIPATTTATVIPACVGRHTGDDNNVSTGEGAVNALSPCFFLPYPGIIMSTIKHQVASTEEQPVLLIDLLVSCSCNLNCRYCYETHKSPRMMEIETAKTVLRNRFAAEAERGKYSRLEISFFGGEPLLNFGLIREISEWMWAQKWPMDYVLCITTNGTLLNDSMRSWLSANKHRIDVSLSLDGLGRMQELNRTTLPVDVNFFVHNWPHRAVTMVLFGDTIGLFAETVSEMLDAGIDINVAIGGGFRWTKEQAIVYEQQLEKLIPYFIHDVSSARRSGIFSNPEHYYEPIPDVLPMCDEESTKKNSYDADGQLLLRQ